MKNNVFTDGANMAAQRSLLRALGWTDSEIKKPLVGIVCAQSDIIPGHTHLNEIARAVSDGVLAAGGKPVIVPSIGVCDGIAMGHRGMKYSLPSREIIADSAEILITAHAFDAAVFVGNCDKIIPGMLLGAVRCNIPSIFVSGGPMLAGRKDGNKLSLSSMFEAVGAYTAGRSRACRLRVFRLPFVRVVLGHVHGKFHELPARSARHGAARQRHRSRRILAPPCPRQTHGRTDHGAA